MARYLQKRKRSNWAYGTSKKRKFVRRRRPRRGSAITSQAGRPSTFGFGNRRLTRRKVRGYRRNLWIGSTVLPKYRLTGCDATAYNTPANLTSYTNKNYQMFKNTTTGVNVFSAAHYISDEGSYVPDAIADNIIFRGGESRIVLSTEADETVEYRVSVQYVKPGPSIPATSTTTDIEKSNYFNGGDNPSNQWKCLKTWSGFLEPKSAAAFSWRMRMSKLNLQQFYTDGYGLYWHILVGNTVTAAANSVTIVREETCWVNADAATT